MAETPNARNYLRRLVDGNGEDAVGEVAANPAANTVLGRLKALLMTSLPAGESHIGSSGGKVTRVSVDIAGHAGVDDYHANDVYGVVTEVPLLARVVGGSGYLVEARGVANKKSIVPRLRLHFFNATGATVSSDGAVHKELFADTAKRMGYVDLPAMTTAALTADSDMSRAVLNPSPAKPLVFGVATQSVWVLVEALDAFVPSDAMTLTVILNLDAN